MSVPTLLALAGTALMAVAIFVPFRSNEGRDERAGDERLDGEAAVVTAAPSLLPDAPRWPELVEPRAIGCDVRARLDLVDALAQVRSPWALGVLHHAREDESDPAVRAAIASALEDASRPLVT